MTTLLVHNLRSPHGTRHKATKRLGRGPGSGQGKTAGKGHKGQLARSGRGKPRIGFEGGQNSLLRRIPKFGFNNMNRVDYQPVSLERLAALKLSGAITPTALKAAGAIASARKPIKVLASPGVTLSGKLDLHLHAISETARKQLEASGGTFQEIKE